MTRRPTKAEVILQVYKGRRPKPREEEIHDHTLFQVTSELVFAKAKFRVYFAVRAAEY